MELEGGREQHRVFHRYWQHGGLCPPLAVALQDLMGGIWVNTLGEHGGA